MMRKNKREIHYKTKPKPKQKQHRPKHKQQKTYLKGWNNKI